MNRNRPVPLWPVAVAAIAALLGACSSNDTDGNAAAATATPTPRPSTSSSPDEPIDLTHVPEGATLEAGKYVLHFLHDEGLNRAVVDVPDGYIGDGSIIGSDIGDAAFWGKVTRVATDPCLGGSRQVGPTVRDLANALAAQRHMSTSRPVPVSIGGYRGLYLKSTAPADLDQCRDKSVLMYTAGGGNTWLQSDVPGGIFRMWILDVDGQRVVAGTRTLAGTPDTDGLNHLIETAEFTTVDET